MSKTFFDLFPVPDFLDPPFAGLSITDKSISFVSFSDKNLENLLLKKFDRVELPDGVIEKGDILDSTKLIEILSDFRKKNDLDFVKVSLPEEKTFLFRTSIPKMSHEDAKEALQFKIEENVPLSAKDSIFDFYCISEETEEDKAVVSVLPRNVVNSYLSVLNKSGFNTVAFEVESQSIAKSSVRRGDNSPFLIVNVEKDYVGLFAVEKGLVQFTSTINLEKDFFLKNYNSGTKDTTDKLPEESSPDGSGIITITGNAKQENRTLKDEIEKLVSYWSSFGISSNHNFKIEKIIACGDVVLEPGFKKYFSDNFDLSIKLANIWINAFPIEDYVPSLKYEESLNYAAAVGLALPYIKDKKLKKKTKKTKNTKKKNV